MRKPAPRRKAVEIVTTSLLVAMAAVVVFVAGPASAASPATTTSTSSTTTDPNADSPSAHYLVLNGTADAASDHAIVGSSAFPNFAKGAVDNYYSMAHTHVDNSPFAEGTASPFDTGPVGQTAAAGNFQQPQYADARWPGDGKAAYGNKGGPYAASAAGAYTATAEASEASNGLSGPSASTGIAAPKGFNGRLRLALAGWRTKWQNRLGPKRPAVVPKTPTGPLPAPAVTVPTPVATVTTPSAPAVGGLPSTPLPPPPSVTLPSSPLPPTSARNLRPSSRSLASASTPAAGASGSDATPGDGESLLESSTATALDPKTNALVTSGESRLGRVSLGGGQIVIEGIHVAASITNDGTTPAYKVNVSIAHASIGGVPVTIDQDGVHLAGQSQGVAYKQASDALNGALKQAGIQLFLVGPEITTGQSCDQAGTGSGGDTTTSTTTTTTTSTTSTDQSGTDSSTSGCDQPSTCDQGTGTGTTSTGTTTTTASTTSTTSTTSTGQTGTTSTTSSCDQSGTTFPTTSSCDQASATTTTSSSDQSSTTTSTTTTGSGDQTSGSGGGSGSGEETITATGLHVVFTQPVSQSGVPSQNVEHILGEVFLDSLAVPAPPLSALNFTFDFNLDSGSSPFSSGSSSGSSSSCLGGTSGKTKRSGIGAAGGGGSSAGGLGSSSSPSSSGFTAGTAASQLTSGSTGGSPLAASLQGLASFLRTKPLWVLLAYLVWQALAVATGASLWKWQRGGAS